MSRRSVFLGALGLLLIAASAVIVIAREQPHDIIALGVLVSGIVLWFSAVYAWCMADRERRR